jgi:hypothetical protein
MRPWFYGTIREQDALLIMQGVTHAMNLTCNPETTRAMNEYLISSIESAQRTIERFAASGFEPAKAIERQLNWCWARATGFIQEPPPAPLCMSYLMENGFTRYGTYPLLAHQLRAIESQMDEAGLSGEEYEALAA